MATAEAPLAGLPQAEASQELAKSWRRLTRAATAVAVATSPVFYVWLTQANDWAWWKALLATVAIVVVFRGFADLLFRRMIPTPSLFGIESSALREEDIVGRRRAWFWRFWFKIFAFFFIMITIVWLFRGGTWWGTIGFILDGFGNILSSPALWIQVVFVFFLFIANFGILFGPLLAMNLTQIKTFEPGDAQWGVKLEDVRGQAEAKEEVRRVVSIWQSGEQFERHGGKRERGVLFFGPPGTGKTMLAKALATGFNSPFVSIPGSGFAATFIGIDAIVVRYLAWKAKRAARKWGGTCIVFIDEIDAVGMRRQALGARRFGGSSTAPPLHPLDVNNDLFFGPWGALNPSGDIDPRDEGVARPALRQPRDADIRAERLHGKHDALLRLHVPGRHGRRDGRHGAQPAPRRDGRHRQPAVLPSRVSRTARTPCSTRASSCPGASAGSRSGLRHRDREASRSTSSARRTSRSTGSIPR